MWTLKSESVWMRVLVRCHSEQQVATNLCAPCADVAAANPLDWVALDNELITDWCLDHVGTPEPPLIVNEPEPTARREFML